MNDQMKILKIRKLADSRFLTGRKLGKRDRPKFIAACRQIEPETTVVFDWGGVTVATSSYCDETLIHILRAIRLGDLHLYPLVVGMNENCVEEAEYALNVAGEAVWIAALKRGRIEVVRVLGRLESPYRETLSEILLRGSISPSDYGDRPGGATAIGRTGWLNRLGYLNKSGFIRKTKIGRTTVYRPNFSEAKNG